MGGTSFAPMNDWAFATIADGVTAAPDCPPFISHEALSVRISIPAVDETMDLIVLSTPETIVPEIESSARTGEDTSKLK